MRSTKVIHVVSCHAEGEVGDVIVGGVPPPPGDTLWEQRNFLATDQVLRNFVLNEPRGGVFRHVNLLVPAKQYPKAVMGFLIMEPADTPPMSGSNSICVATVLLDTGMVPMIEPITEFDLEAPGGLVHIRAYCKDGKAERITVTNVASFVDRRDAVIVVPGMDSPLTVDTAYGGDSFVIVDTSQLLSLVSSASPSPTPSSFSSDGGIKLIPSQAKELAELGMKITRAANEQLGFRHPDNPEWKHVSFCQFTGPLTRDGHQLKGTNAVAIRPGKIDRSPTGTGCSARMALLHARGDMALEDEYVANSIIGSTFSCKIQSTTVVGKDRRPAIFPTITGRAWITGTHQHTLDPTDPFPQGYRLSDTWPMAY